MNEIIAVVVTPEHRQALESYFSIMLDLLKYTELEIVHAVAWHRFKVSYHSERVDVCIFSTNNREGFRGLEFSNVLIDDDNQDGDIERGYLNQLRLKEKGLHYFYNPKEAYEITTKIFKTRGWMK